MRIVLINPPSPYLSNDAAYPPSGLMYIAAVLENNQYHVQIVDFTGGMDWKASVARLQGDIFGITCVTPNFHIVQEIANLLPVKPYIGGVHPTHLPNDALENISCSGIVRGEGEMAVLKLVEDFEEGKAQRVYNGGIVPVDAIPKPARHLLDLHRYMPGGEVATPIYTSRGCPFNCSFCSRITGRTYRVFPISRVIQEIEEVVSLGFRRIVFGDDNIIVQKKRLKELMMAIKPLDIEFRLNQDARTIDEDILTLATDAGCTEISFGIESGSQKMLDLMNKQTTVEANKRAVSVTKKHGIKTKAYFMVNFPGETEDTIQETLDFASQTMPDAWLLSSFAPLPGSDTFARPEKYGIDWMSRNWDNYYLVGTEGNFKPCFTTKELGLERQIHLHELLFEGLKETLS